MEDIFNRGACALILLWKKNTKWKKKSGFRPSSYSVVYRDNSLHFICQILYSALWFIRGAENGVNLSTKRNGKAYSETINLSWHHSAPGVFLSTGTLKLVCNDIWWISEYTEFCLKRVRFERADSLYQLHWLQCQKVRLHSFLSICLLVLSRAHCTYKSV